MQNVQDHRALVHARAKLEPTRRRARRAYTSTMEKRATINASRNGCVITVQGGSCIPVREVRLPPVPRDVVFALANELCARGFLLKVNGAASLESSTRADHSAREVLLSLGFEPPYPTYDETIDAAIGKSATYWDGTPKPA